MPLVERQVMYFVLQGNIGLTGPVGPKVKNEFHHKIFYALNLTKITFTKLIQFSNSSLKGDRGEQGIQGIIGPRVCTPTFYTP